MKLKPKLTEDAFNKLDAAVQALYAKSADGKSYVLDLDGEPDGFVAKDRLDEFRNNNIALKQQIEEITSKMEKFKDVDPELYAKLKAQQDEMKDKKLIDEGKIEELVAQRTERLRADADARYKALEAKYTEVEGTAKATLTRLSSVLIDAELAKTITEVGQIRKGAFTDLMARARATWQLDGDGLVAKDSKGAPIFSKDGKSALSMKEWCQSLAESAPFLFESSSGSGAQGGGDEGAGKGAAVVRAGDNKGFINNLESIAKGTTVVK